MREVDPDENDKAERDGYYGRRQRRLAREREEAKRLADGFAMLSDDESDDDMED